MIDDIPIGAALSRNLGSATAPGEAVEREIDAFIQKRAALNDPEANEELWQQSVRAYDEKRRQMARLEWHEFHCGQAERHRATLQALIEQHEQEAAKLMDIQPEGAE